MKFELLTLTEMEKTGNKFAIVKVNETGYWNAAIIKKAKKVECVYMVNLSEPTHLCSIEVAFPAISLRNVFEKTDKFGEDELFELEMDQTCNEVRYWNEGCKAELIKYYKDETEEEVLDNEAANPAYC